MNPVQEIIEHLHDWTSEQLAEHITPLDTEQLDELSEALNARAAELLDVEDPTDENLGELEAVTAGLEAVAAERGTRDEQAAERTEQAQRLADRIRAANGEDDGGDAGTETEGGEDDGGSTTTETEGGEGTTTPPDETETPDETPDETETQTEAQAASARTRRSRVSVPRPAAHTSAPEGDGERVALVASANSPEIPPGTVIRTANDLGRALVSAHRASKGYQGPRVEIPVATAELHYPADRVLTAGDADGNSRRIMAAQEQIRAAENARAAAGGLCAPLTPTYDLPGVSVADRPLLGAMLRFSAEGNARGGIRTLTPILFDDVFNDADSSFFWDEDDDIDALDDENVRKPSTRVTCPDEVETKIYAVGHQVTIGNFLERTFRELIDRYLSLVQAVTARRAEARILTKMHSSTYSKQVTTAEGLGTIKDILSMLDRGTEAWRDRHRTSDDFTLRWVAPRFLRSMMRTDLVREMPGGLSLQERFAIADAQIQSLIEARGVNVTWVMDSESGRYFDVQPPTDAHPLVRWPSTVKTLLFDEGGWVHLDGGELRTGVIRDSILNRRNDAEIFEEFFEAAHWHGIESWSITSDVCPNGWTAAAVEFDPCQEGS